MKPSIKRYLLFYLLIVVAIISLLNTIAIYYVGASDIKSQLDRELVHSNLVFQSLLSNLPKQYYITTQTALDSVPNREKVLYHETPNLKYLLHELSTEETFHYQVWNKHGDLILKSANSPKSPLSEGKLGLSDTFYEGKSWHVFTSLDKKTGLTIITAARYARQDYLKKSIAQHDLILLLVTFPLLGLLVWMILRHGLGNLTKITNEIAHRAPGYLEPVAIEQVPIEIQPVIDELNKLFGMLRDAFERDKRFAADAAHELKTPLAALKTHAQVALKATDEDKRKSALQNLLTCVDRSTHIVQQLLTLSRSVPDSALDKQLNVNLTAITKEILMDLAPTAVNTNIDLEFESTQDTVKIIGNPASLSILVRNLVDNAIRYTPSGGKVTVELEQTKTANILSVTDSGPGIPDKLRERVFERFFRVLGNNKPGSGLGLAIVKQIADLHEAEIVLAEPKDKKGLVIEIHFPRYKGN
tara:strand:- start:76973 stop:78385 length:1413 start_codon:yes stop_codon:yes gene_type:complete